MPRAVRSIGQLADATSGGYLKRTIDSNTVITAHHVTGRAIDICAALG